MQAQTLAAAAQSPAPVQAVVGGSNSAPNAHTVAAFLRMLEKARKEGVIVYRNADGSGTVPSAAKSGAAYIVRRTGAKWFNLSCTCAAAGHIACKHRAVYAFAWKYGIWATRPQIVANAATTRACPGCGVQLADDACVDVCMACFTPAALGGYSARDFMPLSRVNEVAA